MQQTTKKLWVIFATHGLLITVVSDNGPLFASAEFKQFMNANGVNHHQVPSYHLSSNGVAEEKVEKSANIHITFPGLYTGGLTEPPIFVVSNQFCL